MQQWMLSVHGIPVMQYHFPLLKNFRFKASYYPRKLNEPGGIQGQKHIAVMIMKDKHSG